MCKREYKKVGKLLTQNQFDNTIICAGHLAGGKDACDGDSGGPLMIPVHSDGKFPFFQIGIVSYGFGCGLKNIPGAYTNVQYFISWIQEKLKINPKNVIAAASNQKRVRPAFNRSWRQLYCLSLTTICDSKWGTE